MSYQKYTEEVRTWNARMKNGPVATPKEIIDQIKRQVRFVVEEAQEMQDACGANDIVEVLDALHDLRFVSDQIAVYLEALGIDLEGSWNEVVRSNNSKFTTNPTDAKEGCSLWPVDSVDGQTLYRLVRDIDGKIIKPSCFSEPNLLPFIPQQYL